MGRYEETRFCSLGQKYVCDKCFNDYALQDYILENGQVGECEYCREGEVTILLDEVLEFILEGINSEWIDPVHEAGRSDGCWQGVRVIDSNCLIKDELELDVNDSQLLEDICQSIADKEWCKVDPYAGEEHEEYFYHWGRFCEQVKHKTRYVFYRTENSQNSIELVNEPYEVLEYISQTVEDLDLIKIINEDDTVYRSRFHTEDKKYETFQTLGPPKCHECLNANRMSPAGISMFYGACDKDTSIAEILPNKKIEQTHVTIGSFKLRKPIRVLDLTSILFIPSIFDNEKRHLRQKIFFLREFLYDFQKPIEKDGREHIDYVPTQIVTEYFKYLYKDEINQFIQGIIYPSARKEGGKSCALFFTQEQCTQDNIVDLELDKKQLILSTVDIEIRKI